MARAEHKIIARRCWSIGAWSPAFNVGDLRHDDVWAIARSPEWGRSGKRPAIPAPRAWRSIGRARPSPRATTRLWSRIVVKDAECVLDHLRQWRIRESSVARIRRAPLQRRRGRGRV